MYSLTINHIHILDLQWHSIYTIASVLDISYQEMETISCARAFGGTGQ